MRLLHPAARIAAAASVALLAAPAGSAAAPTDRASGVEAWKRIAQSRQVQAGWTGSTQSCDVGTESQQSIDATLTTLNTLRDLAGLAPVSFDPAKNRQALAAALMMAAARDLSHDPGPDWPCYSEEGDAGAGSSNLALGVSGPEAMLGYVDDSGVESLGHRRWLLSPYATSFGTGSTGVTNALHVTGADPSRKGPSPEVLAWPPAAYLPWALVYGDWSAQIEVPGAVDVSDARVSVTVGGAERAVTGLRSLPSAYGQGGPLLAWRVATTDEDRQADRTVAVTIAGVTVDGAERPFAYEVHALDLQAPVITAARAAGRGALRPGRRVTVTATVAHAATVTYQWLRGSRPIPGATRSTYRLRRADRGRRIRCVVTATGGEGITVTRRTNALRVRRR